MLFWIFVIVLIISILWAVYDEFNVIPFTFAVILGIVTFIMGVCIIVEHINTDAYVSSMNVRYETLVYCYENDIYNNDNDLGKRELMVDIQDWNEDLAYAQSAQKNFWTGIFFANIYDQFEFIDLKKEEK